MTSDFDRPDEPSIRMEEVERRGDPRGLVRDLEVRIAEVPYRAIEASRKGLFIAVDQPDAWPLGQTLDITVSRGALCCDLRTEVVRKEIEPRRGVAVRIIYLTPVAEEMYKEILGH